VSVHSLATNGPGGKGIVEVTVAEVAAAEKPASVPRVEVAKAVVVEMVGAVAVVMRGAGESLASLAAAAQVSVDRASMVSVEAVKAAEAELVVARAAAEMIASELWACNCSVSFVRALMRVGSGTELTRGPRGRDD